MERYVSRAAFYLVRTVFQSGAGMIPTTQGLEANRAVESEEGYRVYVELMTLLAVGYFPNRPPTARRSFPMDMEGGARYGPRVRHAKRWNHVVQLDRLKHTSIDKALSRYGSKLDRWPLNLGVWPPEHPRGDVLNLPITSEFDAPVGATAATVDSTAAISEKNDAIGSSSSAAMVEPAAVPSLRRETSTRQPEMSGHHQSPRV